MREFIDIVKKDFVVAETSTPAPFSDPNAESKGLQELLRLKAMVESGQTTNITHMTEEETRRALWGSHAIIPKA